VLCTHAEAVSRPPRGCRAPTLRLFASESMAPGCVTLSPQPV